MKFHVVIVMQVILGRLGVVKKTENVNISMQSKEWILKIPLYANISYILIL